MNLKHIICLGVVVLGFFIIGYGVHSKRSVSEMESEIHQMSQSKSPMIQSAGKDLEMKVGHEDTGAKWYFISGGLLVILGALGTYYLRHKQKR